MAGAIVLLAIAVPVLDRLFDIVRYLRSPYTIFAAAGAFVALSWWSSRLQRRGAAEIAHALQLANDGRADEAARMLAATSHRYRRHTSLGASAIHQRGMVCLQAGDLAAAEDAFARTERWRDLPYTSEPRIFTAIRLVLVLALRGDTARAGRWLAEARRRLERAGASADHPLLLLAEITLLCRESPTAALDCIDAHEAQLARALSLETMQLVWLLRAFAIAQSTGPRDDGAVAVALGKVHDMPAGAFDLMTPEWPELRAFVETRLGSPSA